MLGGHWDGVVQGGVVRIHDDQLHCERSQKRTAYLSCHFNFNIKSMGGGLAAVLGSSIAGRMVLVECREWEGEKRYGENT